MYEVNVWRLSVGIVIGVSILSFVGCGKSPDQKAYEDIVATMSTEKAKTFFDSYPQSPYREQLAREILGWCKSENTKECYELIIQTLPHDLPSYRDAVAIYQERFGVEKPK
jgi:hypothetical protein